MTARLKHIEHFVLPHLEGAVAGSAISAATAIFIGFVITDDDRMLALSAAIDNAVAQVQKGDCNAWNAAQRLAQVAFSLGAQLRDGVAGTLH